MQIFMELEDKDGNKHDVELPIPEEIKDKTPQQLRATERVRSVTYGLQ